MINKYFRILLFADFVEKVDQYDYIVFCVATIFILVILMNLLISIIGESQERIYSTKKDTESLLLCEFTFELELLVICDCCNNRKAAEEGFLVFGEYLGDDGIESWEGRVNEIDTKVGRRIDKLEEKNQEAINSMVDKL